MHPIALYHNPVLVSGHDEGGAARGFIAALIEACMINGIEPFAFRKTTLAAITKRHLQSRRGDLLPQILGPPR